MGRKSGFMLILLIMAWAVTACSIREREFVRIDSSHVSNISNDEEEQAFEQFLNNELPVLFSVDGESGIYFEDYCSGGFLDMEEYEISRLDLDNDGKEELVIDSVGHYGVMVIDFREDTLYILAEGEGTAGICSYTFIEDEAWIVHSDTTHGGRQVFFFEKFNGDGEVADQFTLSAEYWDEPGGRYTENSDFTYRDEKITMQEYENLRMLYMGW